MSEETRALIIAMNRMTRFNPSYRGTELFTTPDGSWVRWDSIKSFIDYFSVFLPNQVVPENKIPEDEHDNFMDLYWQMLRQIETHTRPERDPLDARLVEGGYKLLNRIAWQGVTDRKADWEK